MRTTRGFRRSSWGFDGSSRLRAPGLIVLVLPALAGCGPRGEVFEPLASPLRWPAPPEPARIEYVGQLVTDRDLKRARTLGEMVFGDKPARSMLSPYALCTDGGDRLFVADSNAQAVHVFDLEERAYLRWPADPEDTLGQPLGVAWHPDGRLLVSDGAEGSIVVLDGKGVRSGEIGAGLLDRPCGLAVDAETGRIFVADTAAHAVLVFDAEGRMLERIGGRGVEPGRFNFPTNVALDSEGNLYVSDSLNFRVQVFDRELGPVRQVGSQGDLPGYFSQPKGVAVDSEGHVYVVDAHFETVQIFDAEGRLLLAFGHEGGEPGAFWLPAGIHVDSRDRIWVADSYNRRVQVFQYLAGAE